MSHHGLLIRLITAVREGERLVGFAKITRDFTEQRAQEEQLLRRARVEEALRVRNEFFDFAKRSLDRVVTLAEAAGERLSREVARPLPAFD